MEILLSCTFFVQIWDGDHCKQHFFYFMRFNTQQCDSTPMTEPVHSRCVRSECPEAMLFRVGGKTLVVAGDCGLCFQE